jgi:ATP-dependent Clp protease ATP-binding subunit ClpA
MMFEAYSTRAEHVLLVARLKAGERGAEVLGVDDLLAALILEDQGMLRDAAAGLLGLGNEFRNLLEHDGCVVRPLRPHRSFLTSDNASRLLREIQDSLPRSQSVPSSMDMPISPNLEHTLNAAQSLMERFQTDKIEPLHLLAAALAEDSSAGARMFREAGITQAKVLRIITGERQPEA